MRFRQAMMSIFEPIGENSFRPQATKVIYFRQPFNNLGLAYNFSFSTSYFSPFADCQVTIRNVDSSIARSLEFDPASYRNRPKIEIRAGYSDRKIFFDSIANRNILSDSLPIVYTGFPVYYSEDKVVGGRDLTLDVTNISLAFRNKRVNISFPADTLITSILNQVADAAGINIDISSLTQSPTFSLLAIDNPVTYNHRNVLTDVFLELAKEYKFSFFTGGSGEILFQPVSEITQRGAAQENLINNRTGMIEHPVGINWTHYEIKTLFGLPNVYNPTNWVRVESPVFNDNQGGLNQIDAVIVKADYNFNDSDGDIRYEVSPDGQPISVAPILRL